MVLNAEKVSVGALYLIISQKRKNMNEIISKFFDDRKESWLKKKLKSSMSDDEVLEMRDECNKVFSLEVWLPNASKRAGQISIATHPCTFSHPSARKNKNGYVTSIIADVAQRNDGFLRSGNVEVESDALGNAAALDVHKFLNLLMPNGKTLLENIQNDSELAQSILKIKSRSYKVLKNEFLEMIDSLNGSVTSSKIKQVYFPVDTGYHQLSILTNSGMVYELKKRLNIIRFGADVEAKEKLKELRECRRNRKYHEKSYRDIFELTVIGYGGTKPQNISVLNSKNAGKSQLLYSMPPKLKKLDTKFPKHDFFRESLNPWKFKYTFIKLHKIFKVMDYNTVDMRDKRKYHYGQLVEKVIEQVWAVRKVEIEQYYEKTSKLKNYQEIWLLSINAKKRDKEDEWLERVVNEIALWVLGGYKKVLGKSAIDIFGTEEIKDIRKVVEENREGLR
jgi:CRISPR-associated protein Csy1